MECKVWSLPNDLTSMSMCNWSDRWNMLKMCFAHFAFSLPDLNSVRPCKGDSAWRNDFPSHLFLLRMMCGFKCVTMLSSVWFESQYTAVSHVTWTIPLMGICPPELLLCWHDTLVPAAVSSSWLPACMCVHSEGWMVTRGVWWRKENISQHYGNILYASKCA